MSHPSPQIDATSLVGRHRIYGVSEMAERTRCFDWAKSAVGAIHSWPEPLIVIVNTLLDSPHPMFLWWGPELLQFYNDAYSKSLGNDKHPGALGQRGEVCWPEIWDIIHPQIQQVMHEGGAIWNEDQLVPIYRDGKLEDVYWTYAYSPVRDLEGKVSEFWSLALRPPAKSLPSKVCAANWAAFQSSFNKLRRSSPCSVARSMSSNK